MTLEQSVKNRKMLSIGINDNQYIVSFSTGPYQLHIYLTWHKGKQHDPSSYTKTLMAHQITKHLPEP